MPDERRGAQLAEMGACGVNFTQRRLPFEATTRRGIADRGVPRGAGRDGPGGDHATTKLFGHPASFKDGASPPTILPTARFALAKTMRNIDLAASPRRRTYVCWGGPRGAESGAATDVRVARDGTRMAFDLLCPIVLDKG